MRRGTGGAAIGLPILILALIVVAVANNVGEAKHPVIKGVTAIHANNRVAASLEESIRNHWPFDVAPAGMCPR